MGLKSVGGTTAQSLAVAMGGEDSLTAFATGGQTSATALSANVTNHRVTTVTTAGDSVKLPAATVGQEHYLRNDGAASMQVFGQATETIDGVASATGVAQAAGTGVLYVCTTAAKWTRTAVYNPAAVAITGGNIDGTPIGATTPAAITGTTVTATTQFVAPNGSTGTAGYAFTAGNGFYLATANSPAVTSGSAAAWQWFTNTSTMGQWAAGSYTLNAASGGAGNSNRAGLHLLIGSGQSTGSGAVGQVNFQQTPAGSSGTAVNAYVQTYSHHNTKSITNNSATAMVNFTLASNTVVAGTARYVVEVFDGTDVQVEEGSVTFHATNKGGAFANNTVVKYGNQQAATAGTLTVTWTITAASPAVLTLNANSSLTPSAGYPRITYDITNLTQQAMALQ